MKNEDIILSISCITYNHEKFIAQTIESFLMQKTTFKIEIVISDDNSTDCTKIIVQEYADKYPQLIRFINRKANIGSIPNFMQTIQSCKGKYIALCEGDDYWLDENKLQMQVDFLENNIEYVLCSTRYKQINNNYFDELNELDHLKDYYQKNINFEITKENIFDPYLLKTLGVVFRNNIIDNELYNNEFCGDIFLFSNLLFKGKGKILNFFGGVYRIHEGGIFSMKNEFEKSLIEYNRINALYKYYEGNYESVNRLYYYNILNLIDQLKNKSKKSFKEFILMFKLQKEFNKFKLNN